MNKMIKRLLAAILAIVAGTTFAAPIAVDQATKAVRTWASARPAAHMTARLGVAVSGADTVKGTDGQDLFHVVRLEGGGYVVTSADDRIEPIIAFSEDADLVREEGNPLWKLLNLDLPQRRAAVESVGQTVAHAQANGNAVAASVRALSAKAAEATDAWADLLSDEATAPAAKGTGSAAYGRSSIPDVRVDPLVETRWNQSYDESNEYCYNLETPNGYVCGCVATAGAQLMRKHCHPTQSVQAKTFSCWVDGVVSSKTMKGGTYDWANMPARPGYSYTTDNHRRAIAKLCYDVGVATRMNWGRGGSGAVPAVLAQSFVDVFKYANAKCHMDQSISETQFRGAIYANLDAGYPVLLGIYGNGGHEIVADGYGYYGSTTYTHLNLGWAGSSDAWYDLPDIGTYYNFNSVGSIVYNVFPDKTGELLTGRITDVNGNPLAGVTVKAKNGSTEKTATSNARGIYAINVTGGKTWTVTASKNGYADSNSKSVTVASSVSSGLAAVYSDSYSYYRNGTVGNSWGNDFVLAAAAQPSVALEAAYVTLDRDYSVNNPPLSCERFEEGQEICAYSRVVNSGSGAAQGPLTFHYEFFKGSSGSTLQCTFDDTYSDGLRPNETHQHISYGDTPFAHLPVGKYRYRVTVTPGNLTSGYYEFEVVKRTNPLVDLTIEGPATVRAGECVQYSANGTFANGVTDYVKPIWTIADGSSYASIDQDGVLTAGVDSRSHTVRILASYSENEGTVSGSKTITIQPAISLNEAVDNYDLVFTTGGDAPWYGQTTWHSTYSKPDADEDSAASGGIGDNQRTWMKTTVEGPGALAFDYCVSTERDYDKFEFLCDGVVRTTLSGEHSGQFLMPIHESGTHELEWRYTKDISVSSGEDAVFIDQVQWSGVTVPIELTIRQADREPIDAGSARQMRADARMSNDTTKYDVNAIWTMSTNDMDCASITPEGLLTTFKSVSDGEVTVFADYIENDVRVSTSALIAIRGKLPQPGVPVITRAGAGDAQAARIAWSGAAYAASYAVYRQKGAEAETCLASNLVVRSFADQTVEPGVDYSYRVEAVNNSGATSSDPATAYRTVSLEVSPATLAFEANGGLKSVMVKSNAEWKLVPGLQDWVETACVAQGVNVTATANVTPETRTDIVSLTAGGDGCNHPASSSILVAQAAAKTLPNLTFAFVSGGDGLEPLYTSMSEPGEAVRLLEKANVGQGNVQFGWEDAEAADSSTWTQLVNSVSLRNFADGTVYSTDKQKDVGGWDGAKCSTTVRLGGSSFGLTPGPYVAYVALDADNRYQETDELDNQREWRFAVRDAVPLQTALDNSELEFETTGDAWFGTKGAGADGVDFAMTAHQVDGSASSLSTTVVGPGTLSFAYRVSSEANDRFVVEADGAVAFEESGLGNWSQKEIHVDGEGSHTFVWKYVKDESGSAGADCAFLDQVVWTPDFTFDPPTGVVAQDGGSANIRVDWNASTGAVSYVVGRSENANGPWTVVKRGVTDTHIFDSKDLVGGVLYYYCVKAVFETGESAWSDTDTGYIKATLSATGTTKKVPGTSGQAAVQVYANCHWTTAVTQGDAWLKVETNDGEGRGKVVFSFDANTTGGERTGKFTITSDITAGDAKSVVITVKQGVPVDLGREVPLAEAADCDLRFVCSGDANWVGQSRVNHDGVDALRSGGIAQDGVSSLSVAFVRSGTLSFWWGTSCWKGSGKDGLELYVAGEKIESLSGTDDGKGKISSSVSDYKKKIVHWKSCEVAIPAGGAVVEWRFIKDALDGYGEDAGFVDQIVWTPDAPEVDENDAWWKAYGANLMLAFPGMSKEEIMRQPSPGSDGKGKFRADGTWQLVSEDYVAGTDPFDSESTFTATIDFDENGVPVIGWEPALEKADAAMRHYQIYGQKDLKEKEWEPVPDGTEGNYNFFKVGVELR